MATSNEELEARQIAGSTIHTFNNVISALTREQQLIAAKFLLRHVRDLVEKLEGRLIENYLKP